MTSDQFMSLVRGVLNLGGGVLVSQGIVSSNNMVTIAGVVTGVAGLAWGAFVHAPTQIVKAADTVKAKGLV